MTNKSLISILLAAGAIMATSCQNQVKDTRPAAVIYEEITEQAAASAKENGTTREERMELETAYLTEAYEQHKNDSVGVKLFYDLLRYNWSGETTLANFEKASNLVKSDGLVLAKVQALQNANAAAAGNKFIDIEAKNILTGETLSISKMLGDKPLLVDFWASWCGPCRNAIKNHMLDLAKSGKVDILGIAVWENGEEDTLKAMEELGITWPVIYTGGRIDSPSIKYGVMGIPAMFLISPDGTIIGSNISAADVESYLN